MLMGKKKSPSSRVSRGGKRKRAIVKFLMEKHGGKCYICSVDVTNFDKRNPNKATMATVDHVIPASKGGSSSRDNLALACFYCNQEKRDMVQ